VFALRRWKHPLCHFPAASAPVFPQDERAGLAPTALKVFLRASRIGS
jgi:hypothetical protein